VSISAGKIAGYEPCVSTAHENFASSHHPKDFESSALEQKCQNSGFKARNYVDLYCESDWDYVNDE
jgi:hypothetical protein